MQPPAPWRKLSGTLVHDHLLKVESHHVRNSAGREFTVPVVRCPGSVCVLAITTDEQVAVVHQHRYAADIPTVELPGGAIDPGQHPRETARQELHEEAQLTAADIVDLGVVRPDPALTDEHLYMYLATGCEHDPDAGPDEECVAELIPFSQALELALTHRMPPYASLAVLLYARERGL